MTRATGDALLIAPIVHEGANSTEAYFPAGTWYNLYNRSTIDASSGPRNVTVQVSMRLSFGSAVASCSKGAFAAAGRAA